MRAMGLRKRSGPGVQVAGERKDMARQDTKSSGIQDQPWWTSGSKYALAFLVLSNLAVLLTIFVPEFSHWKDRHLQQTISKSQQHQEREIARANQTLQSLNRQVEITRLLFDHFFGKPTQEQTAVVQYLRWQFPNDLRKRSLQAILLQPEKPRLRRQIDQSVAAVQVRRVGRVLVAAPVGQAKINVASSQERRGFVSVIGGDLAAAREAFAAAYAAYPTYHNVDELKHRVFTAEKISKYRDARAARRNAILRETIDLILTRYSWGIPPDLLPRLRATLNSL
jgi:hypothetical protein